MKESLQSASGAIASRTAKEISNWIVGRLARMLGVSPEEIHVDDSFSDYGLESVEAVALSGELSEFLGERLSPTLVWDHPTIASLAGFLADGAGDKQAA